MEYCASRRFQEALQFYDYIIIQIDTDVSEDYGVPKQDETGEFTVEQIIEKVRERLASCIGDVFYSRYSERILFAISVHSVECWLLPLYYSDRRKSKLASCLRTLNQVLQRAERFTIDPNRKNPDYYRHICRQYCKHKTLMKFYSENPSLKIFIAEIEGRNIVIEGEDDF